MLTILVEIIMGVFIANYRASEHPIITLLIRGLLVAIAIFIYGIYLSYDENEKFDLVFVTMVSLGIGLLVTLALFIIEYFFKWLETNKS
ncbi:hypothetical protein [Acinetobacter lanii]|uniref:Uncharacterized protein n=1 Tax=Acinetobacter lanii TaxID=2715163 RepID=A0A6G8S1L6_9GAMM|nr:hypothetical protein [Acinetobacter lanii]QIO07980.1 hypothetical protein G8D99_02385 [Acinetobacter lanii]